MDKLILSPAEVAEKLRTSPNTILAAIHNGEIPAYREGRNWKVPMECLLEYIKDRAERDSAERKNAKAPPVRRSRSR